MWFFGRVRSPAPGSVRSLLAFWSGGAGQSRNNGGVRSLLAFWSGGATSIGVTPPATQPFAPFGHSPHRIERPKLEAKPKPKPKPKPPKPKPIDATAEGVILTLVANIHPGIASGEAIAPGVSLLTSQTIIKSGVASAGFNLVKLDNDLVLLA